MRKLQYFFLLVYIGLYIWGWKLFFEIESLSYLKPYAYVWTASAFLCLFLARIKGQFPFTGFFMGSILGPLAAIIILFSEKDLRCYKEEEKDAKFYERLYFKMEKSFYGLDSHDRDFFIDYFKIEPNIRDKIRFPGRFPELLLVLREYKRMFVAFNDEYKLKFFKSFGKVQGMIEKIDKRISELEKKDALARIRH